MVTSASGTGDPAGGLEGLRASVAAGNPDLYRHVALYLQVLRSVLPGRVEQACFHLATQVHVQRYLELPASQRRELHRLLQRRVAHCSSLLTVEQLVALARRLDQEKQQQQQRRQRQLLRRLLEGGKEAAPSKPPSNNDGEPEEASTTLPPGSVRLDLAAPLELGGLNWNLGLNAAAPAAASRWRPDDAAELPDRDDADDQDVDDEADDAAEDHEHIQALSEGLGDSLNADGEDEDATAESETDERSGRQRADEAALMAALIEGLIEAGALDQADTDQEPGGRAEAARLAGLAGPSDRSGGAGRQVPPGQATGAGGGAELSAAAGRDPGEERDGPAADMELSLTEEPDRQGSSPWDEPGLPQDPLLLLRWLDGVEAALTRRLRNLSHAINVDLLRLGLSRGLLPVSLLEAVLQGQIETLASPANVLRLQLPFGLRPGAPPLQAIAILLRPVDLEMEEPRLRTCRRRIHQHRQQMRKMAQTYRRLQRRLQANEAQRLWLQDIRASRTPEP